MNLNEKTLSEIRAHAEREYAVVDGFRKPRESCGLVIVSKGRELYVPIKNVAEHNEHFVMDAQEYADAEDRGEVVMVVHSHPNIPPTPSDADLVGCEKSKIPWLIVNWPTGNVYQFEPSGYKAPLFGRQFSHGVLDCYTFIQDYYQEILGLTLPDFERADEWWLKGQNLYVEGFAQAGFTRVHDAVQPHDVLLMQLGSQVPNHGAVYLGEGLLGHHQTGRLSSRDTFNGWIQRITVQTLRHGSLL